MSRLTPGAPDVSLMHVMVVGNGDGWPVAGQIAIGPTPEIPFIKVIEQRFVGRLPDDTRWIAFVDLIAGKEQQIGIMPGQVGQHVAVREPDGLRPPCEKAEY